MSWHRAGNFAISSKIPTLAKVRSAKKVNIFHPHVSQPLFEDAVKSVEAAKARKQRATSPSGIGFNKKQVVNAQLAVVADRISFLGSVSKRQKRHLRGAIRLGLALREKGVNVRFVRWPEKSEKELVRFLGKPQRGTALKLVLIPTEKKQLMPKLLAHVSAINHKLL
jgi:hypothetical protein